MKRFAVACLGAFLATGCTSGELSFTLPPLTFPGGGTSGVDREMLGSTTECFYAEGSTPKSLGPNFPGALIQHQIEGTLENGMFHIRLTLDPAFVDNTYGATSIGWKGVKDGIHTFEQLVGSDHALINLFNGAKELLFILKVDYISVDTRAPSGYSCLGIWGGEGAIQKGDKTSVVKASTSMDRNLNERGYSSYTIDSPATDDIYTPNQNAPLWDYRVMYEIWVKSDAFGASGFGGATVDYIHASPAKGGSNTIEVDPGDCPDGVDGGSGGTDGGDGGVCDPNDDTCNPF